VALVVAMMVAVTVALTVAAAAVMVTADMVVLRSLSSCRQGTLRQRAAERLHAGIDGLRDARGGEMKALGYFRMFYRTWLVHS